MVVEGNPVKPPLLVPVLVPVLALALVQPLAPVQVPALALVPVLKDQIQTSQVKQTMDLATLNQAGMETQEQNRIHRGTPQIEKAMAPTVVMEENKVDMEAIKVVMEDTRVNMEAIKVAMEVTKVVMEQAMAQVMVVMVTVATKEDTSTATQPTKLQVLTTVMELVMVPMVLAEARPSPDQSRIEGYSPRISPKGLARRQ